MYHHVARARPGELLFVRWSEGLHLWHALARTFPEAIALCVMPDHVHLVLPHPDEAGRFARVRAGHSRRLGRPVWAEAPPPAHLPDELHLRRTARYVVLNPCRARLVSDPLAWPLSTHRDRVGFSLDPAVPPAAQPEREHAWVSGDPSVVVEGTPLPRVRHAVFDGFAVLDAVAGVCRAPRLAIRVRGPARTLFLQAAWIHRVRQLGVLAAMAGCTPRAVRTAVASLPVRGSEPASPALAACVRAVGDPRFAALEDFDLRGQSSWFRYRNHGP